MPLSWSEKAVVDRFHRLYYNARKDQRTLGNTFFLGVPVMKCPLDLWVYQELLHRLRPDLVIETGTAEGGSALFLASIMDLLGVGRIVTIDVEHKPGRPEHPRIEYLQGSSTAPESVAAAGAAARGAKTVMLILDSDHSRDHVLAEMRLLGPLVTKGSYMIVEDSNVNGHPVRKDHGPGPMEAIKAFLDEERRFEIDSECEKFFLTFNPSGYLKRM